MSQNDRPQWEDCKVCGGDHWTKDHESRLFSEPCSEARLAESADAAFVAGGLDAMAGLDALVARWQADAVVLLRRPDRDSRAIGRVLRRCASELGAQVAAAGEPPLPAWNAYVAAVRS